MQATLALPGKAPHFLKKMQGAGFSALLTTLVRQHKAFEPAKT